MLKIFKKPEIYLILLILIIFLIYFLQYGNIKKNEHFSTQPVINTTGKCMLGTNIIHTFDPTCPSGYKNAYTIKCKNGINTAYVTSRIPRCPNGYSIVADFKSPITMPPTTTQTPTPSPLSLIDNISKILKSIKNLSTERLKNNLYYIAQFTDIDEIIKTGSLNMYNYTINMKTSLSPIKINTFNTNFGLLKEENAYLKRQIDALSTYKDYNNNAKTIISEINTNIDNLRPLVDDLNSLFPPMTTTMTPVTTMMPTTTMMQTTTMMPTTTITQTTSISSYDNIITKLEEIASESFTEHNKAKNSGQTTISNDFYNMHTYALKMIDDLKVNDLQNFRSNNILLDKQSTYLMNQKASGIEKISEKITAVNSLIKNLNLLYYPDTTPSNSIYISTPAPINVNSDLQFQVIR